MGKTCELLKQYLEDNHLLDNGKQDCPLFYSNSRQRFHAAWRNLYFGEKS
jgi:hypothetical protein